MGLANKAKHGLLVATITSFLVTGISSVAIAGMVGTTGSGSPSATPNAPGCTITGTLHGKKVTISVPCKSKPKPVKTCKTATHIKGKATTKVTKCHKPKKTPKKNKKPKSPPKNGTGHGPGNPTPTPTPIPTVTPVLACSDNSTATLDLNNDVVDCANQTIPTCSNNGILTLGNN